METMERHNLGQVAFAQAVVPRADIPNLGERVGRVLAYAHEPLLAVDIARELGSPGNLRDRTQMVRAELRNCEAFVERSRGRWELGRPSGYESASLSLVEIEDYMERRHKDTRRTWPASGTSRNEAAASGRPAGSG
jgi:hypothetical protein